MTVSVAERIMRAGWKRVNHAMHRAWKRGPQYTQIGKYRVRLAKGSQWPAYREHHKLYDTPLAGITTALRAKYPDLCAIDVGANVGDTAAIIRDAAEIPVLCVEGDPLLLPVLRENVARLGSGVTIEPSFIGKEGLSVNLASADDLGRNASLVRATNPNGALRMRSLQAVLSDHPAFSRAKLFKTDTEGFDFDIIRGSVDYIEKARPVIFFEYDPHLKPEEQEAGLRTLDTLMSAGYCNFIYFDNFGNFLLHCDAGRPSIFTDLDKYLGSHRKYGVAVYYFDICAIHTEDEDIVSSLKAYTQK